MNTASISKPSGMRNGGLSRPRKRVAEPHESELFSDDPGEMLQRMDDEDTKYSIALPDLEQYRRLWSSLSGGAHAHLDDFRSPRRTHSGGSVNG